MYIHINPHMDTLERVATYRLRIHCLCCLRECTVFFFSPPHFHPLLPVTLHSLQEKEVRKWKEELLEQRRRMMEERLLHAEFKRELQLQAIVKKAQEEEAKVIP